MNENRHHLWSRECFELAYTAVFVALNVSPGPVEARHLAAMTELTGELFEAVSAMRSAPPNERMFAAFKTLRKHRLTEPQS